MNTTNNLLEAPAPPCNTTRPEQKREAVPTLRFTPTSGSLEAGHYTATVSVHDEAMNQSITENWSFTALASVSRVYLPLVRR